ncbi:hypothetical protein CRUP_024089 [Coryphaenoides rupestris]|nr:hypothetical protein CRUP_024089 [Coryphaenoides rupestris]
MSVVVSSGCGGAPGRRADVWLGGETGVLKAVSPASRRVLSYCCSRGPRRDREVRVLCWGDPAETELLLGSGDGSVRTFSTQTGEWTSGRRCAVGAERDDFTGLAAVATGDLVTCGEAGRLRVWRREEAEGEGPVLELSAGGPVSRMRQNPAQENRVATGGRETVLKVWDLQRPDAPIFSAKNLRDDWLGLRQPEWLRDVRVYDPATPQRRPVLEVRYGEHPLTCLSVAAGGQAVVVGNTQGGLAVLDLRKGAVRAALKGLAGGVRGLQCHASLPLVASCGLDRFLRIHSLETRALVHKVYLKSRLNCLLLASTSLQEQEEVVEVKEEDDDEVWQSMEQVEEKSKRKAPEEQQVTTTRKRKVQK